MSELRELACFALELAGLHKPVRHHDGLWYCQQHNGLTLHPCRESEIALSMLRICGIDPADEEIAAVSSLADATVILANVLPPPETGTRQDLARELIPLLVRAMHDGDRGAARDALYLAHEALPPHSHLSDDDSEAQAAASEQIAQFREGDVLPSWGDRPLTAREAAALNERPEEYAATGDDLRKLARTDHAAFLASLNLRVDEWIELMGSGTPEGDAELSRFAVAVLREDNVDPGQMFARLRRARQRYKGDPGFRAYVDQVATEWEPPGDQSSDRSEP